jgi:hypothetical protein
MKKIGLITPSGVQVEIAGKVVEEHDFVLAFCLASEDINGAEDIEFKPIDDQRFAIVGETPNGIFTMVCQLQEEGNPKLLSFWWL